MILTATESTSRFQKPNRSGFPALLAVLKAVSDETRLRILHILSFGSFSVNEIIEILGMGQSRISRHLKILTDAGLLQSRREGSWVYYGFRPDPPSLILEFSEFLLSYKEELPFREIDQKNTSLALERRTLQSRNFFNDLGKNWELVQEKVLSPRNFRDRLVGSLPDRSDLILDLGCGPGGLVPYLLGKANRVLGFDSSSKMVEIATREFAGNDRVEIQEAELEDLPLPENSADSVVASMVLHHLSHPPRVLEEVHRVLKPHGTFCIVDLVKHNQEFMREKYADLWLGFDSDLMSSWLESVGFQIVSRDEILTDSVFKILSFTAKKKED